MLRFRPSRNLKTSARIYRIFPDHVATTAHFVEIRSGKIRKIRAEVVGFRFRQRSAYPAADHQAGTGGPLPAPRWAPRTRDPMTNPDPKFTNPETALGGADAVQKTTYGVGQGTDPSASSDGASTAHPSAGSGPNYLAWGIGVIAILVAIAYAVGAIG